MSVDLSTGTEGIIEWTCSRPKYWCPIIEPKRDGTYEVRIESGWYELFYKDGRGVHNKRCHIASFTPCKWGDPRTLGLKSETNP